MTDLIRRRFMKAMAMAPIAAIGHQTGVLANTRERHMTTALFTVRAEAPERAIARSLIGLSYSVQQIGDGSFFSPNNRQLVKLFRELNGHGTLRLSGDGYIWSEYHAPLPVAYDKKHVPINPFVLRPEAIHALAQFLDATGWDLIFGLSLKAGAPDMSAAIADAVKSAVGKHLIAVQVGNEPNNYEPEYASYESAWKPHAKAIHEARVPLAGPDTGANTSWVVAYADRLGKENVFLSRHYYRGPRQDGSIEDLLSGQLAIHADDPAFFAGVDEIMRTADAKGLPFRVTEANSYYLGGCDGVSNVFASALWAADFALALAKKGVTGVNFMGGTAQVLGWPDATYQGDDPSAKRNRVSSVYSPITGSPALGFEARPIYYGMQFAAAFGGARMLSSNLDAGGANLTAYAGRKDAAILVALINKDMTQDALVLVKGMPPNHQGRLMRLRAPTLASQHGVAFEPAEPLSTDGQGSCRLRVPSGSAVLITLAYTDKTMRPPQREP